MKQYLRNLWTATKQCTVILVVLTVLYVVAYLAFYQELPRWK